VPPGQRALAWASVENSFAPVGFPDLVGAGLAFDAGEEAGLAVGAAVVVGAGAALGAVAGAAVV
jgi:hypothetical protein